MRQPLPVSEKTMKAIWEFFCKTSVPRMLEEQRALEKQNKKEESA